MSTNSMIGIQAEDGSVKGIYSHSDGFIEAGVGELLLKHYKTASKINRLIALGSISILEQEIGVKHPFERPYPAHELNPKTNEYEHTKPYANYVKKWGNMVLAYHRDRNDPWEHCAPVEYKNADKFWESDGEHWAFMYLFSAKDKTWQYRIGTGIPKPLTKEVVAQAYAEREARIAELEAERERKNANASTSR